ncbi:MAG: metallophosphoesterase family protein [Anaerolineae bacterium]
MRNKPSVTVGVLADTHLPYRLAALPPQIFDVFSGVDLILHAGDVDEARYLRPLARLAPVHAVRGNVHLGDRSWGGRELPVEVQLTLATRQVVMTHGHRPGALGWAFKIPEIIRSAIFSRGDDVLNREAVKRLRKRYPRAEVVVFGHTHVVYCRAIGRTLFFNPGAVVPTRNRVASVGLLRLQPDTIEVEIIPLGRGERRRCSF